MNTLKKINDLKKKLEDSEWEEILYPFINSTEFQFILNKLIKNVENNIRFTPIMGDWFNCFIKCKFNKMNVIFINQDPYPQINIADGMAFSSSKSKTEEKAIKYIFDYIKSYDPDCSRNPNLERWAKQGVLLLNTCVTTELNKFGSHELLWKPFITYLLQSINKTQSNIIVILFGKKTEIWENLLNNQIVIKVEHPNIGVYKFKWEGMDIFNKINNLLTNQNKSKILW